MYDHELNPVKGWGANMHAVDKHAEIASGVEGIYAGMCLSLDANGKWVRGCANGAMPGFAFPNQGDFDVSSDVGNISGGNLVCLMAAGAYELESTEFVGSGFAPNVPLTAENVAGDDQGKLKVTTIGSTDMVVGVCSAEVFQNEWRKNMVRFWPVYLPSRA
jgi:hypothetical protein